MRNLINIVEDPVLKKEIIGVVKATDDLTILQRVLNVLKAGNIDDRIKTVIGKDADAQRFIKQIVTTILAIEAPIEEKNLFLDKYAKGTVINTKALLDKKLHSFEELVGPGFTLELFKRLSVDLVSQGVGPGEVALAVLSPEIVWSGRSQGGGDVQIKQKPVEVKTRVSKGGRWVNARKAKMNLGAIASAINSQMPKGALSLPDRINATYWVETIRPKINPKSLKETAKKMADATFKFVDNSAYQKALISGDASQIVNAFLEVGYNNYKEYSGFVGMLLMDVPTEQTQYFEDFNDMEGTISASTTYIFAPESEMMPQVILQPGAGPLRAGRQVAPELPVAPAKGARAKGGVTPKQAYETQVYEFAKQWANRRGITDDDTITSVYTKLMEMLAEKTPKETILKKLGKFFPDASKAKPATPAAPVAPPVPAAPLSTDQNTPTPAPGLGRPRR